MSDIIIYHTVSSVHHRNLGLIAKEMSGWSFRMLYYPEAWWNSSDQLAKLPFEKVAFKQGQVPETAWTGNVRAVIVSTAQPHQPPINLVRSALERNIPIIAIEETNQIALNQGRVNNYVLPVDYVLVASDYERNGMIKAGFPPRRVEVTGWPFFTGEISRREPNQLQGMKRKFGLDPNRPVATLTLTGLNDAGESPTIRRRQLTLAAQGLPPEYQLVVKPHPCERLEKTLPFIAECSPKANVIEGRVHINDLLAATDVLLNRGVSQVCFEALLCEIPIIILDTGVQTPFHSLVQDLIVTEPEGLHRILSELVERNIMPMYIPFMKSHLPYSPLKAREITCRRIAEIAITGSHDSDRAGQWFDLALYQAWRHRRQPALEMLGCIDKTQKPIEPLSSLIQFHATRSDLEVLKQYVASQFHSYVLRSLWIDQLYQRKQHPTASDLEWMEDFPPQANTVWFYQHIKRWLDILLRSGNSQSTTTFAEKLRREFADEHGLANLVRDVELYYAGLPGRAKYISRRTVRQLRAILDPIKHKLMSSSRGQFLRLLRYAQERGQA